MTEQKQYTFYVAGPFRGADSWAMEQNIRRAEAIAWCVFAEGEAALCPHTNTRFFQGSLPDEVWIRSTLTLMRLCDAVLVLPGYQKSSGTLGEIEEAKRLGIPYFFLGEGRPEEHNRRDIRAMIQIMDDAGMRAA